ncbi:hypothetical protein MHUMG1_08082 [Metarhizium humberi]|uniref:Uncharacterized protein n=1 Tax=Metarhizium humberi TaxID=2596975 RepID=A0A9P8S5H5_9HYPO|nr:hypothetical protein MHUMG1_08082 [Metarhizium humberi]
MTNDSSHSRPLGRPGGYPLIILKRLHVLPNDAHSAQTSKSTAPRTPRPRRQQHSPQGSRNNGKTTPKHPPAIAPRIATLCFGSTLHKPHHFLVPRDVPRLDLGESHRQPDYPFEIPPPAVPVGDYFWLVLEPEVDVAHFSFAGRHDALAG